MGLKDSGEERKQRRRGSFERENLERPHARLDDGARRVRLCGRHAAKLAHAPLPGLLVILALKF